MQFCVKMDLKRKWALFGLSFNITHLEPLVTSSTAQDLIYTSSRWPLLCELLIKNAILKCALGFFFLHSVYNSGSQIVVCEPSIL